MSCTQTKIYLKLVDPRYFKFFLCGILFSPTTPWPHAPPSVPFSNFRPQPRFAGGKLCLAVLQLLWGVSKGLSWVYGVWELNLVLISSDLSMVFSHLWLDYSSYHKTSSSRDGIQRYFVKIASPVYLHICVPEYKKYSRASGCNYFSLSSG